MATIDDRSSQLLYHGTKALRVTGEVTDWQGHSPEELKALKDHLERLKQLGIEGNRGLSRS